MLGDFLIHYFNLAGAYIICASFLAIALYFATAFSFSAMRVWAPTRFAFAIALWNRWQDWRQARARSRMQEHLEKQRAASKPVITSQLVSAPAVSAPARPSIHAVRPNDEREPRSGIDRTFGSEKTAEAAADVEVTERADSGQKPKTTLPRLAGGFKLPPSSLLHRPDEQNAVDGDELKLLAQVLTEKYAEFDVRGKVTQINPGPVVTTFEFKPEAGIKYSRITNLTDDLCLALKAESILIERVAGKSTVGIQVPNREREIIWLRENIESQEFIGTKSRLTLALGKDINGRIVTADLAGMPHLLIAGSTGAGKSVAINAMIMSILYKATPEQVR
ncbi:MAG: DNA translocase FtsK, partial [Acidobacteriales bacterium]|nr:DNA translocase FtsK [Terriglobales bacterium]